MSLIKGKDIGLAIGLFAGNALVWGFIGGDPTKGILIGVGSAIISLIINTFINLVT